MIEVPMTICIPTLNNFDGLNKMIEGIEQGSMTPERYLIVDNSNGNYIASNPKVEVHTFGRNLGVAASWNWMIDHTSDLRLICNDDLVFHTDTLEIAYNFIVNDKESYMWCSQLLAENAFSFFGISKKCIQDIGYFDDAFYPAYYEDCDYARRLLLKGKEITKIPGLLCDHAHSMTKKNFNYEQLQSHHDTFAKNQAYFISKWGGMPTQETYTTPFNSQG